MQKNKNSEKEIIKVLIVDDSSFMRKTLRDILSQEKDIEVVGEAENGQIAVEMAESLEPNMITMDLEMPIMNGFEATQSILKQHDIPIIVVSSLTQEGTDATFKALKLGAVDYISKSSPNAQIDLQQIKSQLLEKIRFWHSRGVQNINYIRDHDKIISSKIEFKYNESLLLPANNHNQFDVVVIGASSGAPSQLPELFQNIEIDKIKCPIILAVHIPSDFISELILLIKNIMKLSDEQVIEGKDGLVLKAGKIIVAKGDLSTSIEKNKQNQLVLKVENRNDAPIQPWIDLLFKSAIKNAHAPIGVILTGLDNDGVSGSREFIKTHSPILVQNPKTCMADTLPMQIITSGIASEVLDLNELGQRLTKLASHL